MPEKKSFLLYMDREKEISMLSNEQGGILLKAIFQYARTGVAVEISDPVVKVVFSILATQIDEDSRKWEEKRQKRSEAGKKGGRPKKQTKANESNAFSEKAIESNEKQTKAKKAVTDTVTVTDTVVSVTNVTDTLSQPCTAAGAAAQADNENGIRYGRIIDGYQTIIDEYGNEVIPIDPNDDFWA